MVRTDRTNPDERSLWERIRDWFGSEVVLGQGDLHLEVEFREAHSGRTLEVDADRVAWNKRNGWMRIHLIHGDVLEIPRYFIRRMAWEDVDGWRGRGIQSSHPNIIVYTEDGLRNPPPEVIVEQYGGGPDE